jgi:hypothetical protein
MTMKLNILFCLPWNGLLLLCALFTPPVYALNVVLTVAPSEGPPPLSVRLSAKQTVASPGESIYRYKWQVSGPKNFVLGSVPGHVIILNEVGQYTITLTIEETTKGGLEFFEPEERNSGSANQVITVTPPPPPPPPSGPISICGQDPVINLLQEDDAPPIYGTVVLENFETTELGVPIEKKFTIQNTGSEVLEVGNFQLLKPEGFSPLVEGFDTLPEKLEIAPGEQKNFSIKLDAKKDGTFSNVFLFNTNDCDKSSMVFHLEGVVTPKYVPPTARFTAKLNEFSPNTVFLDASKSTVAKDKTIEYVWSVGVKKMGDGSMAFKTFKENGPHEITLVVKDDKGASEPFVYYVPIPTPQDLPEQLTVDDYSSTLLEKSSSGSDFYGGVLIKDQFFLPNGSAFSSDTFISIVASITAVVTDASNLADVYVVAEYIPEGIEESLWFMKNGETAIGETAVFEQWVPDLSQLKFAEQGNFESGNRKMNISIFSGQFTYLPGTYKFYVAYRPTTDSPVTLDKLRLNLETPITFTVVP